MPYIGVMHLRLSMPWVSDLKTKRALVRPAVERLRARFPVAVARTAGQNAHTYEEITLTTVHSDYIWVQGVLRSAEEFLAEGEYNLEASSVIWALDDLLDTAEDELP